MADDTPSIQLVENYIEAIQRARASGDDVYVEQLSTIVDGDGTHVSMVCHIFSVVDGLITGVRGYRNERGLPAG
jgi:limonene-1,2-epoxide hydrolase